LDFNDDDSDKETKEQPEVKKTAKKVMNFDDSDSDSQRK